MVKINKPQATRTHEGAKGRAFTPEAQLRRALMNCMLWEDQFYEDGVSIAQRIGALVVNDCSSPPFIGSQIPAEHGECWRNS